MKINNLSRNNPNFTGMLNNKLLLKSLEKISEHGTSFSAGTSLAMSLTARPLAIWMTPDTEKENKQYAISNSICSGFIKFGMVEAVALPIENAVKMIDKNPQKFMQSQTIKNLQNGSSNLLNAKGYKFATQMLKLGTGFVTAIPKSILTIALIPVIMDKLFKVKKSSKGTSSISQTQISTKSTKSSKVAFTGKFLEPVAKGIGKLLDNEGVQKFAKKYADDEKNIAKHMAAGTDILLTTMSSLQIFNSSKIKEDRKKALVYSNIIATGATLGGGYGIDRIIKKQTEKFVDKFVKINAGDAKLHKYIQGINIVRPAIIFAAVYYGILPVFSTYLAEKTDKFLTKSKN